jgi:hypothetical protein
MNASPTKGVERVVAAREARERETNASGQLTAPEAAGRRETKEPCPMETTESTGAQDINVPEKETAAVRRDGEPLAGAAMKRRQEEAAAGGGGCRQTSGGCGGTAPFICERRYWTRATVGQGPRTQDARRGRLGSATASCCESQPSRNLMQQAIRNPYGWRPDRADGEAASHSSEKRQGLTGHRCGETQLRHNGPAGHDGAWRP